MAQGINWCRDIDYGNLPQWLTFGVAFIVGCFTIFGIRTARRAYKKSVDDTHVAQARLCYAAVIKSGELHPSQPHDVFGDEPYDLKYVQTGGQFEEAEYTDDKGNVLHVSYVQTASVNFVRTRVRNNSDEVISDVAVELLLADGSRSGMKAEVGTVDPESDKDLVLVVDEFDRTSVGVRLSFMDSAGARWERINALPVVATDRKGRFARAWKELWTPTK